VRVIAALFKVHRATLYRVLADEAPSPFPFPAEDTRVCILSNTFEKED
jgi:hypothetical protein